MMQTRRWMLAGSVALVMFSCGTNARDSDSKTTDITADMFAEEYRGRLFMEMFDSDGNVEVRADLDDAMIATYVDPKGRVFLADLSDPCDVWIDPSSSSIPAQSCATIDTDMTIEYAGTWALSDGELELDLEAIYTFDLEADADDAGDDVRTVKTTFTGTQTAPPNAAVGPDEESDNDVVVIDEEPPGEDPDRVSSRERDGGECESVAECRADQECSAGACLDHLYCGGFDDGSQYGEDEKVYWYQWESCSDGKEYFGACAGTEADEDWQCVCTVNDVTTGEFIWPASSSFRAHRVFNEGCGWLVPELYSY